MSTVIPGLKSLSKQSLIAEVNFYRFGVHRVYFTANAIGISLLNFPGHMKPGHMKPENENQKVTVCFLKTVTSWAKRTSWSRMRQRLEQGLLNWIRSSRIYMAVQMLIYRNSASCWPQIQLENGSRLISALMQNCWAVQDCRTHFISQLCTRGVGPDSRTPGLKRTRCPSEIRSFS